MDDFDDQNRVYNNVSIDFKLVHQINAYFSSVVIVCFDSVCLIVFLRLFRYLRF
jgi:hypothetical protein